jgi:hypothetical protein
MRGSEMQHGTDTIEPSTVVREGDVIEFTHRGERRTAEVMIRTDDDQVLLDLFDGDRPAFAHVDALVDLAVFRPDATFTVAA